MMFRLKLGNFIALFFFLFPPRRHSGPCVITTDLRAPCELLSSPTSPGSSYSAGRAARGPVCLHGRVFSFIFNAAVAFACCCSALGRGRFPARVTFCTGCEFFLNNRILNSITHSVHWLMDVFIVYYYGFILSAGLVQFDPSAVYTQPVGFI